MRILVDLWRRFLTASERYGTRWLETAFALEIVLVAAVVLLLWLLWA